MSHPSHDAHWRSPELGVAHEVRVTAGRLRYHQRGDGPPLVFAHGWLANANLWRKLVPLLAERYRCITPDLPFGAHQVAMDEGADLTPLGCGQMIAGLLEALRLEDVTLVGNDSGGAYSQIAASLAPERIGRLILNSCETPYDPFPPAAFAGLVDAASDTERLAAALGLLKDPGFRASNRAYGWLAKRPIDDDALESYVSPIMRDAQILRDASHVMRSAAQSYIQAAGERLTARFTRPVLFIWSPEDKFFPLANARRYADALPDARVQLVQDAYSFTPEDQPVAMAELIRRWVPVTAA
jgi:pimeloyl-ACP methyl ester carboxylesterase